MSAVSPLLLGVLSRAPRSSRGTSCHLSLSDNETSPHGSRCRCSCIAPIGAIRRCPRIGVLPTSERSVLPPSAASRRLYVAVVPPEHSPRVLVIPLALLPYPLSVVAPVSPLALRDRRGRIGVVPVACAAAPAIVRHHVLSPRSQSWPQICCSVPALPSEGCLGAAMCFCCLDALRDRRGRTRVIRTIQAAVSVIVCLRVLPLCHLCSPRLPCSELALVPPPSCPHAAVHCAPVAPAPSLVKRRPVASRRWCR